jgi:hypothetical protein
VLRPLALAAVACGFAFGLAGCGDAVPQRPPAAAAPASAPLPAPAGRAVTGRLRADLPLMTFTAATDGAPGAPGEEGVLEVRAIDIRRAGEARAWQRIDGLDTRTPWSADAPGLELLDMNFDGYADLRLVEGRPAGPNVPYLNWLYDPGLDRFVPSPALDAISSPRFDATRREIRSDWRDGATRYGTDVYKVVDGQPVPSLRETRTYTGPGAYTLETSRWVDGAWQVVERRQGRDP